MAIAGRLGVEGSQCILRLATCLEGGGRQIIDDEERGVRGTLVLQTVSMTALVTISRTMSRLKVRLKVRQ